MCLRAPSLVPRRPLWLRTTRQWLSLMLAIVIISICTSATAQIKRPGAHPRYSAELEPHVLAQWDQEPFGLGTGLGLGFRATIPLFHNGPIREINNNMGITFGFDWAHFNGCPSLFTDNVVILGSDCDADMFWFPVAAQWNFWLTDTISVYGEPGLAIAHARVDVPVCGFGGGLNCDESYADTDLRFVFFAGGRFLMTDGIALMARLGTPYISFGVSFLL